MIQFIIPIIFITPLLYGLNKMLNNNKMSINLSAIPPRITSVDLSIINTGNLPDHATDITKENLEFWIEFYSNKLNLDVNFVKAICQTESSFGKYLINENDPYGGAYGAFQFLLPTAKIYAQKIFKVNYSDSELKHKLITDARFSSALACAYIFDLLKEYGDYKSVLYKYKGAISDKAKEKVEIAFLDAYRRLA